MLHSVSHPLHLPNKIFSKMYVSSRGHVLDLGTGVELVRGKAGRIDKAQSPTLGLVQTEQSSDTETANNGILHACVCCVPSSQFWLIDTLQDRVDHMHIVI